jgi:hypothetical protein
MIIVTVVNTKEPAVYHTDTCLGLINWRMLKTGIATVSISIGTDSISKRAPTKEFA